MKNKPYKKKIVDGEIKNPIIDVYPQPFANRLQRRTAHKYINSAVGKMKKHGNNRASTCKRKNSRTNKNH